MFYLHSESQINRIVLNTFGTWKTIKLNYNSNNVIYYSFKIFLRFWLVKTALIIHHNQLLLAKYWTADVKVQPAENYWTDDVKNAGRCRLYNRSPRKPGDMVVFFWGAENQRAKLWNSFKNGEIFWMNNKTIINSAFVGYEEFRRSRRVLSTSAFGLCG